MPPIKKDTVEEIKVPTSADTTAEEKSDPIPGLDIKVGNNPAGEN